MLNGAFTVIVQVHSVGLASAPDIPVPLLTCGAERLLPRLLRQLAQEGVQQIHLVSDAPAETFAEHVGDGARWGLQLQWHLTHPKFGMTPFLLSLGLDRKDRVLLLNASDWATDAHLSRWISQVCCPPDTRPHLPNAAWFLGSLQELVERHQHNPGQEASSPPAPGSVNSTEWQPIRHVRDVMAVQTRLSEAGRFPGVPASWQVHAWGRASPSAVVSPDAVIHGPVLIGPGCLVGSGAHLGPNVVLAEDVMISAGVEVKNSLILDRTYVARGLCVNNSVIQGQRLCHLELDIDMRLPESEGLLLDWRKRPSCWRQGISVFLGRVMALLLWLLLGLWQFLIRPRLTLDNRRRHIDTDTDDLAPRQELGLQNALLDIVRSRRRWFGVRRRKEVELALLPGEWAQALRQAPIGLCVFPSREDMTSGAHAVELLALADLYWLQQDTWSHRFQMMAYTWRHGPSAHTKARSLSASGWFPRGH